MLAILNNATGQQHHRKQNSSFEIKNVCLQTTVFTIFILFVKKLSNNSDFCYEIIVFSLFFLFFDISFWISYWNWFFLTLLFIMMIFIQIIIRIMKLVIDAIDFFSSNLFRVKFQTKTKVKSTRCHHPTYVWLQNEEVKVSAIRPCERTPL